PRSSASRPSASTCSTGSRSSARSPASATTCCSPACSPSPRRSPAAPAPTRSVTSPGRPRARSRRQIPMVDINGQQYQHATTKLVLVGKKSNLRLKTVSKCNYKVRVPKELTNDSEGQPDGFVFKKEEHEFSITLKYGEYENKMRPWLIAEANGLGTLQATFDF